MTRRLQFGLLIFAIAGVTCAAGLPSSAADAQGRETQARPNASASIKRETIDRIIATWAARPRLGALQMIEKYGPPQEASGMKLVWHNAGPFKRIAVMNLETPHDFPLPHVDFMEHTVAYDVPEAKLGELLVFDGSSTINRTTGELSARCDLESHNVLTLNLDHDIVTGKKTVEQARQEFGRIVEEEMQGKKPRYTLALQFKPSSVQAAMFADSPVIAGSPVRASQATGSTSGDSEVLGILATINRNEINAAMVAEEKKISGPAMEYAKHMHVEHGVNMAETLKAGQQAKTTPVVGAKAEELSKKGAQSLGELVPKDGDDFGRAYIDAMAKDHAEVLAMIDNELMGKANSPPVKTHLANTRTAVAEHLAKAKSLQAGR